MRLILTITFCLAFVACADTRPYTPLVMVVAGNQNELFDAIQTAAKDLHWQIFRVDPDSGQIEAYAQVNDLPGVTARQHWTLTVTDNQIAAALSFEAKFDEADDAPWVGSTDVCSSYEYLREKETLVQIAKHATQVAFNQFAARR